MVLVKRNCYHSHRDPTCPPLTNAIAALSTMNARVFPEARKSRRTGSSRKEAASIPLTDGCTVFTRGGVSLGMYEWSTLSPRISISRRGICISLFRCLRSLHGGREKVLTLDGMCCRCEGKLKFREVAWSYGYGYCYLETDRRGSSYGSCIFFLIFQRVYRFIVFYPINSWLPGTG